jgi:hypothetical protein
MAWTDFIGPIIDIAGNILGGSDKENNAGAKTKAALSGKSKADARISAHQKFVTGFIDERVDIKSGHNVSNAANDASKLLRIALADDGDLPREYENSIKELISRLKQAQIRV